MLRPLGHKLLVEQDKLEEKTDWGLEIIRENEKLERAALMTGTIVSIGPDCWKAFRQIDDDGVERNGGRWAKEGDRVMYAKYGGAFVTDPETDKEYVLLNDEDLHCVIEGEKDE